MTFDSGFDLKPKKNRESKIYTWPRFFQTMQKSFQKKEQKKFEIDYFEVEIILDKIFFYI